MSADKSAVVPNKKPKVVAVLVPKKLPDGRWQVSLGSSFGEVKGLDNKPKLGQNGKPILQKRNLRKQFSTRADAQDYCNNERARRKAHGAITAGADGELVGQWLKLEAELRAAGAGTLVEAGKRILRDTRAIQNEGTAVECFDAFHSALTGKRRGTYRSDLRNRCNRFIRHFGETRPTREITPEVIEAYLKTLKNPGDFNTLSAWLGWAAKNRWLPTNPCTGKKPDGEKKGGVVTLSPNEAARLLKLAAETTSWSVLAHVAISLFAGLRPAEFRKVAKGDKPAFLLWKYFGSNHVALPPELCKNGRRTGQGRTVKLEPTLAAWIAYIRKQQGGTLSGKVVPDGWKKLWKAWREDHWRGADKKPIKWANDQLRHSFGSYHLARGKSLAETSFQMENSPAILKRHYWNWETLDTESLEFWALTPAKVLEP